MKREGYFQNGRPLGGALNQLFPLPPEILDGRPPKACSGLKRCREPVIIRRLSNG